MAGPPQDDRRSSARVEEESGEGGVFGSKAKWIVAVVVLGAGVFALDAVVGYLHTPPILPRSPLVPAAPGQHGFRAESLRERNEWAPDEFFYSREAIRACELISQRKHQQLEQRIESGLDVNVSGKAGMTLLYWAFADGDLDAFKLLLASGADPDKKLTEPIPLRRGALFHGGDSVLFTSMRSREKGKWDFFFAALNHTRDVNQRDGVGNTLLLVCMGSFAVSSTSQETLQRLLESGVDLDALDKYGGTATMRALMSRRPLLCLQILKAGADPQIRNARGRTLADLLPIKLAYYRGAGRAFRPLGVDRLKQWLDAHRSKTHE